MKQLAYAVAVGALVLGGCGNDLTGIVGDTCSVESIPASQFANNCTSQTVNTSFQVAVQVCPRCYDRQPTCAPQIQGNAVFLDAQVQRCSSDCTQGCAIAPVTCSLQLAPGSYTLFTTGSSQQIPITVQSGGMGSCTL